MRSLIDQTKTKPEQSTCLGLGPFKYEVWYGPLVMGNPASENDPSLRSGAISIEVASLLMSGALVRGIWYLPPRAENVLNCPRSNASGRWTLGTSRHYFAAFLHIIPQFPLPRRSTVTLSLPYSGYSPAECNWDSLSANHQAIILMVR